jgi:myo-inositol-1(or 4)-monophosphatase
LTLNRQSTKAALTGLVTSAGEVLLSYFGKIRTVSRKEHPSSVVCAADLASEKWIVDQIRARFPGDGLIAEESGYIRGESDRTWVIDPLDGTSNFVAGVPWFGAQVALLRNGVPWAAAMFIPVEKALYYAARGEGVTLNGRKIVMSPHKSVRDTLCAFGFDPGADQAKNRRNMELLRRVASGVRNVRATNCLVDVGYTLEGLFGGFVNLNTKIWDIAPGAVMFPEAGGVLTHLDGTRIKFDLSPRGFDRSYAVAGAKRGLHRQLIRLLKG